jgi:uncharacterized protein YcfJ
MRILTTIAVLSALSITPTLALADDGGAASGAVTGAVTGAVVGGPVGAAVGGAAGAVIGGTATGPNRSDTVIVRERGSAACSSTTVRKENEFGESKTVTRQDC